MTRNTHNYYVLTTPTTNHADATDHNDDVLPSPLAQLLHQLGQQRLMPRGERAHAHDVHVVVHGVLRRLGGRLEERAEIYM